MEKNDRVNLGMAELRQLVERAHGALSAGDCRKLKAVVDTLEDLTEMMGIEESRLNGVSRKRKRAKPTA